MCDTTGVTSLRNPDLSPIEDSNSSIHHHHHHHQSHHNHPNHHHQSTNNKSSKHHHSSGNNNDGQSSGKQNQVGTVLLFGVPIVSLVMDRKERLCLAQISSTLLKDFSYNEIHNRRVALGITCVQCTPVQLEILRRAGAMPVTSRRCGMITRREAERLCQSFLGDHAPPQLPENFAFEVYHECGWGSRGSFVPSRYNSSRAKCIRCTYCQLFFSPNKFIFHSHRLPESRYVQPDAANFNSWRRHLKLCGDPPDDDISISSNTFSMDTAQIVHCWEDVRAMFNGGTRKRMLAAHSIPSSSSSSHNRHYHHGQGQGHISSRNENHHGHTPHRRGTSKQQALNSAGSRSNSSQNISLSSSKRTTSQSPSSRHHPPANNHNNNNNNVAISGPIISNTTSPSTNHSSPSSPPPSFLTSNSNNSNNITIPLLSPSARLDIWNPGLSPVGNSSSAGRLAAAVANSQLSHLPFHPLSIPWLRRPLFSFPHPFTPAAAACHLLAGDVTGNGVGGIRASIGSQSAFKPVSHSHNQRSNADHLFSWLNNNNATGNNNTGNIMIGSGSISLPEDLSTTNHQQQQHNSYNHLHSTLTPLISGGRDRDRSSSQERSSVSSTNDETNNVSNSGNKVSSIISSSGTINNRRVGGGGGNNIHNTSHSNRHQIAILSSAAKNDSDDEENVDIESTEVEEEECSSTSFIWVTSSHNNNNNSNSVNINIRRKPLSVDSNNSNNSVDSNHISGEDEKFNGESESGSSSPTAHPKRKRLWDFDASDNNNPVKKPSDLMTTVCCDETTRTSGFEMASKE